jgi:hypothetical protein
MKVDAQKARKQVNECLQASAQLESMLDDSVLALLLKQSRDVEALADDVCNALRWKDAEFGLELANVEHYNQYYQVVVFFFFSSLQCVLFMFLFACILLKTT